MLGVDTLSTTQDAGYFNAQQIKECEAAGINIFPEFPGAEVLYNERNK